MACPFCHSDNVKTLSVMERTSKKCVVEVKCFNCSVCFEAEFRRGSGLRWELVKAKPVLDEYAFSRSRLRNIEALPPKTLKNMKEIGLIKEEKKIVSITKEIRARPSLPTNKGDTHKLVGREILADNIDAISNFIRVLSYAGHGCLSIYWEICKRKSINARYFIDHFRVGSRAFRRKYRLFSFQENYKENRWMWIRKILLKLRDSGFISIEPVNNSPPLGIQPARLFADADYLLKPLVSKITFIFPRSNGQKYIETIVDAHNFIRTFVPRHIPPPYYPRSALRRSFLNKIRKFRGKVVIRFPLNYS